MVTKNAELVKNEGSAPAQAVAAVQPGAKVYRTPEVREVGNLNQMQGHEGHHHDHPHHHHHHHHG